MEFITLAYHPPSKAPVQFSKLSTYGERKEILDSLIKIKSGINHPHNSYSYPSLDQSLDQLKQSIRPFHIRHTKERLIEFNDEFNDCQGFPFFLHKLIILKIAQVL
jgi:hypothetical protein